MSLRRVLTPTLTLYVATLLIGSASLAHAGKAAPADIPFQQNVNCAIASGSGQCSATVTVPAGDTLVVQSVSAYRIGPNGSTANVFLESDYDNSLASYPLVQIPAASATPFPGTTLAFTAYAQAGTSSFVEIYRGSSSGAETDYFTVSGYLTPATK